MRETTQNFRIDKISIRNYKGIDSLDLEFPRPKFPNDPDIFVIGSRNGLGKTSVLECCALGLMALGNALADALLGSYGTSVIESNQSVVRLGSSHADIDLTLSSKDDLNADKFHFALHQEKSGAFCLKPDYHFCKNEQGEICKNKQGEMKSVGWLWGNDKKAKENYHNLGYGYSFSRIFKRDTSNPCIEKFFHFYPDNRATPHGKVPFGEIQGKQEAYWNPTNVFKIVSIQAILGMAGLWRKQEINQFKENFEELNKLTREFTKFEISRQFEFVDNIDNFSMDLEVQFPSKDEEVFSFDGLSSGQKEMITTLFLIWENTRRAPKVVFIDEPEQHLNAEWHRLLIHTLHEIAPWNQYIIATHSKHIVSAVDDEHRIMLTKSEE